jgi:hypothetical protein
MQGFLEHLETGPLVGLDCCAHEHADAPRAVSGQAAAPPPTSVMKSRRFTGCPSDRGCYPTMLTVHGAARQIWIN